MPGKDWKSTLGNLYDSMPKDPNGDNAFEPPSHPEEIWSPSKETVYIYKDRKMRKGKTVTVVEGIEAPVDILEQLSREIKTVCGTGGSVKDTLLIIQGDFVLKIRDLLVNKGFKVKTR